MSDSAPSPAPVTAIYIDEPSGQGRMGNVWWKCNHCGEGRSFYGTVRQEAAEARAHQAACPLNPDRKG